MSEFSSTAEPKASTIERPAPTPAPGPKVWQRPYCHGAFTPLADRHRPVIGTGRLVLVCPRKKRVSQSSGL
nr:hypothetical protein pPsy0462b_00103 [Pseudomonas syringae]